MFLASASVENHIQATFERFRNNFEQVFIFWVFGLLPTHSESVLTLIFSTNLPWLFIHKMLATFSFKNDSFDVSPNIATFPIGFVLYCNSSQRINRSQHFELE